jgi:hypothetical protein
MPPGQLYYELTIYNRVITVKTWTGDRLNRVFTAAAKKKYLYPGPTEHELVSGT